MVAQSPKLNIDDLLGTVLTRPDNAIARPVRVAAPVDVPADPIFSATTMIATLRGPRAAGRLEPGDLVLTRDSGYVAVTGVRLTAQPARQDNLLADDRFQAAFGSREVLVGAQTGLAGTRGVILALASAEIVLADGVWTRATDGGTGLPRPVLTGREAAFALRLASGSSAVRGAAAAR
jgi:hypothetical protein